MRWMSKLYKKREKNECDCFRNSICLLVLFFVLILLLGVV